MAAMLALCTVLMLLLLQPPAASIPLADFYPYGSEEGDSLVPKSLDGNSPGLTYFRDFSYLGTYLERVYVNINGHITFNIEILTFSARPPRLSSDDIDPFDVAYMVAPFYADVDTRNGSGRGHVWYRDASSDRVLLTRATEEVRAAFADQTNFEATFVFVATWDHVGFYQRPGSNISSLTNTFQCVLISGYEGIPLHTYSYAMFLYADGLIQWTTGENCGSCTDGFGRGEAQAGFDLGTSDYMFIPGSGTPEIINISSTSNVGREGVWLFRVDDDERSSGTCFDSGHSATLINVGVVERSDDGQSFTLECGVSCVDPGSTIAYEWTRGSAPQVLGTGVEYVFVPSAADDGGTYCCAATVAATSGSLGVPVAGNGSITISTLAAPVLSRPVRTSNTITIWWAQTGNFINRYVATYSYTIRGCGLAPVSGSVLIGDGSARYSVLRDLVGGSDYDITLTALRGDRQATSNQRSTSTPDNTAASEGERCVEPIFTECSSNPCENGASCRMTREGAFICSCPFGFTGILCQMEVTIGSGLFGGGDLMCPCEREVECSIAGTYDSQRATVLPRGPNLQCVIDFSGDALELDSDTLQDGSGFGVSPFVIDDMFDVSLLSAGSYSFLGAIGVFSRQEGDTSCTLRESQESLLEVLHIEEISLIFQREGLFDSLSLNTDTVLQIFQGGDYTVGGQLDETLACSIQYLLDALTRPPSSHLFSCRNPPNFDLSTVVIFRVFC